MHNISAADPPASSGSGKRGNRGKSDVRRPENMPLSTVFAHGKLSGNAGEEIGKKAAK
jgi:hypothetical protein